MSVVTIEIPDSLADQLKDVAARQGISLDQLLTSAAAEKLSALLSLDHLRERAARGDQDAYQRFLDASPDVPAMPGDELQPN